MNNMQNFSRNDLVTAGLEFVLYMLFFWILRPKGPVGMLLVERITCIIFQELILLLLVWSLYCTCCFSGF